MKGSTTYSWEIGATSYGLSFYSDATSSYKVTIQEDGNVGIGTVTPSGILHTYQTTTEKPVVIENAATNAASILALRSHANRECYIEFQDGSVGRSATKGGAITYELDGSTSNPDVMRFHVSGFSENNSTASMSIVGDGNVGINTLLPEHKLHVAGDAIISGVLYDSTNSSGDLGEVLTSEVGGPQWKMIEDVLSGVGGNGTADYIPRWIDSDTIGDSVIAQSGSAIGIGTAAPAEILEVVSDSDPTILIRPVTVDSANSGKISYRENAGGTTGVDLRYDGANNKFIIDTSDVTNALVIKRTDGNVGIGTDAPGSLLRVEGSNATAYDATAAQDGDGVTLSVWNQDQTALGSYAALQLVNKGTGSHGKARIACVAPANNQGALAFTVESAGTFKEAMRILGDGKVGIGTTNPLYDLHIKDAEGSMRVDSTTGTNRVGYQMGNTGGTTYFMRSSSTGTGILTSGALNYATVIASSGSTYAIQFGTNDIARMTILGDGKVGIGTNAPNSLFQLDAWAHLDTNYGQLSMFGGMYWNGSAMVRSAGGTRKAAGMYMGTGGDFFFITAPETSGTTVTLSDRLVIKNDGNVGIGEAAPSSLLQLKSDGTLMGGSMTVVDSGGNQARFYGGLDANEHGYLSLVENDGTTGGLYLTGNSEEPTGYSAKSASGLMRQLANYK